jgi:hypothetical protein
MLIFEMIQDTKKTSGGGSTSFSDKRAFGGIYSHSADDIEESKFAVDAFAIYSSTNALYPVCQK